MRVENAISDGNRYGIVVAGGADNIVVNCTVTGNASMGMSLASGSGTVAFNNLVSDTVLAVNIGEGARNLTLDYNLYLAVNMANLPHGTARNTLNDWRYVSGQDRTFGKHPGNLRRGHGELSGDQCAGLVAGSHGDGLLGDGEAGGPGRPPPGHQWREQAAHPWRGRIETWPLHAPSDGAFTVPAGAGQTSAGVFDADNRLVSYLFQTLPLPAGTPLWLPSFLSRPAHCCRPAIRCAW